MKRLMVRYKVKEGKGSENQDYIARVFEELKASMPEGLRYASFKLDDGLSFVHLASVETPDGHNPLSQSQAFKAFQAEIKDRCQEPPVAVELHEIGAYRMFGQ